jgi:hypothetical protein
MADSNDAGALAEAGTVTKAIGIRLHHFLNPPT